MALEALEALGAEVLEDSGALKAVKALEADARAYDNYFPGSLK